jgi:DNA-binding NtrC family response regulator
VKTLTEIRRFGELVGASEKMEKVFALTAKAASVSVPVLIDGETGTGKELVAREIHTRSSRRDKPFIAVNTGALPPELVISELFGHEKGAFTGASDKKDGRFSEAHKGTLFLDELTTMDERVQVALLRVLELSSFRPVGAKQDIEVNVRLVAATNQDLREEATAGHFRHDLVHRLEVFRISLPPLREHTSDIPLLVSHFLDHLAQEFEFGPKSISDDVLEALRAYSWPGNIRELKNVIAQAGVMAEGSEIELEHLPPRVLDARAAAPDPEHSEALHGNNGKSHEPIPAEDCSQEGIFVPMGISLDEVQKAYVVKTLQSCSNNKTHAARVLGVSRKTLYDRLAKWGIHTGDN